jgi:hypothetical protein
MHVQLERSKKEDMACELSEARSEACGPAKS